MRKKSCSIANKKEKDKSRSRSRSASRKTKKIQAALPLRPSLHKVEEEFRILTSKVKSLTSKA